MSLAARSRAVSFCYFALRRALFTLVRAAVVPEPGLERRWRSASLASLQSGTRRVRALRLGLARPTTAAGASGLLRLASAARWCSSLGFFVFRDYAWIAVVCVALMLCTAGVMPMSEAVLAHHVSSAASVDIGRYGRVRRVGIGRLRRRRHRQRLRARRRRVSSAFRCFAPACSRSCSLAAFRLPPPSEPAHAEPVVEGALAVLREPGRRLVLRRHLLHRAGAHQPLRLLLALPGVARLRQGGHRPAVVGGAWWSRSPGSRSRAAGRAAVDARLAGAGAGVSALRFAAIAALRRPCGGAGRRPVAAMR